MSIRSFVTENGESAFRDREASILRKIVLSPHRLISLGGGVLLRENNRKLLKSTGTLIWLRARPQTLYERLKNEYQNRPFLEDLTGPELLSKIETLLGERISFYEESDLVVDTDDRSAYDVALEIREKLVLETRRLS